MKKLFSVVALSVGATLLLAGCGPTRPQQDQMPEMPEVNQPSGTEIPSEYNQDSWKTMIPESCKVFSDGCNTCSRMNGGEPACTQMLCQTYSAPRCLDGEMNVDSQTGTDEMVGMPNPASVHCTEQGGTSEIRKNDDGSEYGVCKLADGEEREEWEFYRASEYVGLTVSEADAKAKENGGSVRIVEQDGQPNPVTTDLRPGRVNVHVVDGKITKAFIE